MEKDLKKIGSFLRDHFYPFSRLSEAALKKAADEVIRVFELRQGEQITLGGARLSEDYLYLLEGCISMKRCNEIYHTYRMDTEEITDRKSVV